MPVYVYRNQVTGETFEIEQRITEDALTVDPTTGDPVRRVIQPVGISFKGSGFYVNDSRSGQASSGGSGAASSAGTDSSPAGSPAAAADSPKTAATASTD